MSKDLVQAAPNSDESEDTQVAASDYKSAQDVHDSDALPTTTGSYLIASEFVALDELRGDSHRAQLDIEKLRRVVTLLKARKLLDG